MSLTKMKKPKLKQLKLKIYRQGISPAEVRSKFGDLRFRKTWEAAYSHYIGKNKIVTLQRPMAKSEKVSSCDRNSKYGQRKTLSNYPNKIKLKYIKEAIYKLKISPKEVSDKFGSLKRRKTWEDAYEYYELRYDCFNKDLKESEFQEKQKYYEQLEINYMEEEMAKKSEIFRNIAKKVFQNPIQQARAKSEKVLSCDRNSEGSQKGKLSNHDRELLFGETKHKTNSNGQFLLFSYIDVEPPDPDDCGDSYEEHYQLWAEKFPKHATALENWKKIP